MLTYADVFLMKQAQSKQGTGIGTAMLTYADLC
jgi:hypothetical protein